MGGTRQPSDWNPKPSASVRAELLKKAAEMYPAILNNEGKFEVIRDIVGWRPAREGGLRLEVETQTDEAEAAAAAAVGFYRAVYACPQCGERVTVALLHEQRPH